jgi:methanogenic corrinoid protein MtbC1
VIRLICKVTNSISEMRSNKDSILESLRNCIVNLMSEDACRLARQAKDAGTPTELILTESVSAALEEVGRKYEQQEYFLSELVMAGEVANDVLKEILPATTGEKGTRSSGKGKVVIGTVQGDLHDLGKNIVINFLLASGLDVVDLGVDVPPGRFLEEVRKNNAQIMGLSCLLTTCLPAMKETIATLEKSGLRSSVKVIVGGRPVTESVAKEVGADACGRDAADGARKTLNLLGR